MTGKVDEDYRTIGEVAESLGLPQHVLRFWETRFTEIAPLKRAGGRRLYRASDVELVAAIRRMLYDDGYTIKGVQRILKEQGLAGVLERDRTSPEPEPIPEPVIDAPPEPRIEPEPPEALRVEPPPFYPPSIRTAQPPLSAPSQIDLAPRPLEAEDARRLEAALAEIGECVRLLALTRR